MASEIPSGGFLTSTTLLARIGNPKDSVAWETFVRLYSPLLFYWAKQRGLQQSDSEDLVQKVLIKVFKKVGTYRRGEPGSFRSWLNTVLVHQWIDDLRKKRVEEQAMLDDVKAEDEPFFELEYRQYLFRRVLEMIRDNLDQPTWCAAWETLVNQRADDEVAEELGVAVATVRVYRYRVLLSVRERLGHLLD